MKSIAIVADSRSVGTCRSCGARVEWAASASGKRIPFDPPIVVDVALLQAEIVFVDMNKTTSHFATCPQANEWRRK